MKKIILSIIAITLASLVFVLSGCELSFNANDEATQSHTAIIEITDESGNVVGTEAITISADELEEGENFYETKNSSTTAPNGVSQDRIQQGLNNGGNASNNKDTGKTTASKNEANKNDNGDSTPDELPAGYDDAQILKSSQYMIIGRNELKDGSVIPFKIARSGEKIAVFTEYNGNEIGLIVLEEKIYILSANNKMYLEVTKELLKDESSDADIIDMFTGSTFDNDAKVIETKNQAEDGVVYDVVVYETGLRTYYLGGTIIKSVSSDGSIMYYDKVSAVVPSSVFAPPADYTRETLDETATDFAGILDTTEA